MRFYYFRTPPKDWNIIVNIDCLLHIIAIYLCMQVIAIHITGTEIDHLGVLKAQVGPSVCLSVCLSVLSVCLSVYLCAPLLYYIIYFCIVKYCIVLYWIPLWYIVWYDITLNRIVIYYHTLLLSFHLILYYIPEVHCTALNFLNLTMLIAASYLSHVYLKFQK